MTVGEVIRNIASIDDDLCIVAAKPWVSDSECELVNLTEEFRVPEEVTARGLRYFLKVNLTKEKLVDVFPKNLTPDQVIAAVIYYAEFDATPAWFNELMQNNARAT